MTHRSSLGRSMMLNPRMASLGCAFLPRFNGDLFPDHDQHVYLHVMSKAVDAFLADLRSKDKLWVSRWQARANEA
jgi:hypothetical protein